MHDTDIQQQEPVGYKLAWMDDTGNWRTLQEFSSYSEADLAFDEYDESGEYDNTMMDIIPMY
jgi:hypothetical protein